MNVRASDAEDVLEYKGRAVDTALGPIKSGVDESWIRFDREIEILFGSIDDGAVYKGGMGYVAFYCVFVIGYCIVEKARSCGITFYSETIIFPLSINDPVI